MECCGRERETPYCPECGRYLEGSIGNLLKHCRLLAEQHTKRLRDSEEYFAQHLGSEAERLRRQKSIDHRKVLVARWTDWADWIEARLPPGTEQPAKSSETGA